MYTYSSKGSDPAESSMKVISPYLFDSGSLPNPNITVKRTRKQISGLPKMIIGSKPVDGGHFIFTNSERIEFLKSEPAAKKFMRPYIGNDEFVNNSPRWILVLHDAKSSELARLPNVKDRIAKVRQFRLDSTSSETRKLAIEKPHGFHVDRIPTTPFLFIPNVTQEDRAFIPIGWLTPPTIPNDSAKIVENASTSLLAILMSSMHMAWLKFIGGRLGNSFRYSIEMVYNTFPVPPKYEQRKTQLEPYVKTILAIRNDNSDATLSELYYPDSMPRSLANAHGALNRAVEKLYRKKSFQSDLDRIEHLLLLYEEMVR